MASVQPAPGKALRVGTGRRAIATKYAGADRIVTRFKVDPLVPNWYPAAGSTNVSARNSPDFIEKNWLRG